MTRRSVCVGLIAEDLSDIDATRILIRRIAGSQVSVKHFVGHGCGRIKSKCRGWAEQLKQRGCTHLILLHDRDRRKLKELTAELKEALSGCVITERLLCIPVEEIEAWLLADPEAIATAVGLNKPPKIPRNTEAIPSPKEFLQELVRKSSKGERIYLHTRHNEKVAEHLHFEQVRRCSSFVPFYDFVVERIRPRVLSS